MLPDRNLEPSGEQPLINRELANLGTVWDTVIKDSGFSQTPGIEPCFRLRNRTNRTEDDLPLTYTGPDGYLFADYELIEPQLEPESEEVSHGLGLTVVPHRPDEDYGSAYAFNNEPIEIFNRGNDADFLNDNVPRFLIASYDEGFFKGYFLYEHYSPDGGGTYITTVSCLQGSNTSAEKMHDILLQYLSRRPYSENTPEQPLQPSLSEEPIPEPNIGDEVTVSTREATINQIKTNQADLWMQAAKKLNYSPTNSGFYHQEDSRENRLFRPVDARFDSDHRQWTVNETREQVTDDPTDLESILHRSTEPSFIFQAESGLVKDLLRVEVGTYEDWFNSLGQWEQDRLSSMLINLGIDGNFLEDQMTRRIVIGDDTYPERRIIIDRANYGDEIGWNNTVTIIDIISTQPIPAVEHRAQHRELQQAYDLNPSYPPVLDENIFTIPNFYR